MNEQTYEWKVDDVFVDGDYRWRVDVVFADGRAVLQSCSSPWAKTVPLHVGSWLEGGRWKLEEKKP